MKRGTASVKEHVSEQDALLQPQRIQSALLKCNGFLASPWTEIATNHLVVAARLAMLPSVRSASTFNGTARGFGLDAAVDGAGRTGRELVKEAWEAMNALVSYVPSMPLLLLLSSLPLTIITSSLPLYQSIFAVLWLPAARAMV